MDTKHIEKAGVRKFASMNSSTGFVSYFDNYFNSLSYLYILKGGPGTGKSYLMNRLADEARHMGYSITYFHCSSDPDSLDGIIVNELKVGMMDGTAPHTRDPKYPGVKEEIINLGDFWRRETLLENKNSVKKLSDEKSICYSRAISMLNIYDKASSECEKTVGRFFDREKAYNMFLRLFKNARSDHKPRATPFVYESPGMKGIYTVTFPKGTSICKIPEYYGLEYLLTDTAVDALSRLGITHEYSYSPFRSGRINALYIPSLPLAIIADKDESYSDDMKIINPKRFINTSLITAYKKDLRELSKSSSYFIGSALDFFEKMKKIHFGIEDIYLSSMDLYAKEKYSDNLIKAILKK